MKQIINASFLLLLCLGYQAQAQTTVDASKVLELLDAGKDVSFSNAIIKGDLDFTKLKNREESEMKGNWKWGGKQRSYRCKVQNQVSFEDCVFKGEVIGYLNIEDDNELYNADFEAPVAFVNCQFEEDVNFKYSKFEEGVNFSGSDFQEEAFFKYSEFRDFANFANSNFGGEATFKYTKFPKGVNFSDSEFKRSATFKYTKFPRGVDFSNTSFQREANFKYAKFFSPAKLSNTDFGKDPDFKYTTMDGESFVNYLVRTR